jgi:hypothetical protein
MYVYIFETKMQPYTALLGPIRLLVTSGEDIPIRLFGTYTFGHRRPTDDCLFTLNPYTPSWVLLEKCGGDYLRCICPHTQGKHVGLLSQTVNQTAWKCPSPCRQHAKRHNRSVSVSKTYSQPRC